MRVLVVEDDAKIASFVVRGLKQAGYAVDHAPDGETGLALAFGPGLAMEGLRFGWIDDAG